MTQHTILLSRFSEKPNSRKWTDYDTVADALDGRHLLPLATLITSHNCNNEDALSSNRQATSTSATFCVNAFDQVDWISGMCQMFESLLKRKNPTERSISYEIDDLYEYIDGLPDLVALV
jgi:hypothetical protein